jgi:phage terminase large subunit-like protein
MGETVSFACLDWEAKLKSGQTPIAQLPLNQKRADRSVAIFNSLRLPDVAGMPALAEGAGEWFRDIVRNAFAAEDPETGAPLVNEVFALVPKKNSKTTYAAALGLTALLLWDKPNASMMILGPTQNVAQRCFEQAAGMIKANPALRKVFHVQDHLKTITRIINGSTLSVKTFDLNVVTGEIPALTIIDELHVVAGRSYAERVIKQITGGTITNASALVVYITTQSDTEPQGVFKTKLAYARGVRDGTITDRVRMLPVLYEFPASIQTAESKPWRDPALWPMVLPNLGLSVQLDLLKDRYAQAMQEGIESEIIWASQHLNIEIGLGIRGNSWPGALFWEAAGDQMFTLDTIVQTSDVCTIGFDGGGLDDLAALAVLGRHRETRVWQAWVRAWAQPEVFDRRKEIAARLRDFERHGDLIVCESAEQAVMDAADLCERVQASGLLPEKAGIGLDAYGIAALLDELEARDMGGDLLMAVGQGWKLQSQVLGLPLRLKAKTLVHCGRPMMAWAVGNAKVELRGSNYMVTKAAAGSAKIDPLMALFNAGMLMQNHPEASGSTATPWDRDPTYRFVA